MAPTPVPDDTSVAPMAGESGNAAEIVNVWDQTRKMPKFEVDEDIVISGIAGRFPEADTLDEFADNLYKNINMVTLDDRRWPQGELSYKILQNYLACH